MDFGQTLRRSDSEIEETHKPIFSLEKSQKNSEPFKEIGEERRTVNFNVPTWCSDLASV